MRRGDRVSLASDPTTEALVVKLPRAVVRDPKFVARDPSAHSVGTLRFYSLVTVFAVPAWSISP
jgi:hypothetical protein